MELSAADSSINIVSRAWRFPYHSHEKMSTPCSNCEAKYIFVYSDWSPSVLEIIAMGLAWVRMWIALPTQGFRGTDKLETGKLGPCVQSREECVPGLIMHPSSPGSYYMSCQRSSDAKLKHRNVNNLRRTHREAQDTSKTSSTQWASPTILRSYYPH